MLSRNGSVIEVSRFIRVISIIRVSYAMQNIIRRPIIRMNQTMESADLMSPHTHYEVYCILFCGADIEATSIRVPKRYSNSYRQLP